MTCRLPFPPPRPSPSPDHGPLEVREFNFRSILRLTLGFRDKIKPSSATGSFIKASIEGHGVKLAQWRGPPSPRVCDDERERERERESDSRTAASDFVALSFKYEGA